MQPLLEHQKEGVEFLLKNEGAILADEMGLGKTRQAVIAAQKRTNGAVVVCPASLKTNWAREILVVDPDAHIEIIDGGDIYTYHHGDTSNWLIINYDVLHRDKAQREAYAHMPKTLILDEAHYIKNKTTKRTKEALRLAGVASYTYLLTGTPILNRPIELYTLLQAVGHDLVEGRGSYGQYAKRYCEGQLREIPRWITDPRTGKKVRRVLRFMDVGGASNLNELAEKIEPVYLRRTKDTLGDRLPEKVITNVEVELTQEYRERYDNKWEEYIEYLQNIPQGERKQNLVNVELARHIIELNKLKQVASQGKIADVVAHIERIAEAEEKVIVFTQYTETLQRIKEELRQKKIKAVSISGEDNSQQRQKAVDTFQEDEKTKAIVANIKAGGVGLTLTAASTVIFADMEWTPALHHQAEDRAHRMGQKRQVNVYYYIAKDTVDEDIVELLGKKQQIIEKVLRGEEGVAEKDITKDAVARMLAKNRDIHTQQL